MKSPSFLMWSKVGTQLAAGSEKGKVLIYDKETYRSIPIQGRHTKKISCGSWSKTNKLALGGLDKLITVSNAAGDLEQTALLKGEPTSLSFARQKFDESENEETTISVNLSNKTLLLHDMQRPMAPIELAFQRRYGNVQKFAWYGDGYILIMFSEGFVVALSTHSREISEELKQLQVRERDIHDVRICEKTQKFALLCASDVKIGMLNSWRALESFNLSKSGEDRGNGAYFSWTEDGKLMTISTSKGYAVTFLVEMNLLVDTAFNTVAYLSSLQEVTVFVVDNPDEKRVIHLSVGEPNLLRCSETHVTVAFNHMLWIYNLEEPEKVFAQIPFSGAITDITITKTKLAVLASHKIFLGDVSAKKVDEFTRLPERNEQEVAVMYLRNDFLFYCLQNSGSIVMACAQTTEIINEYKHPAHIRMLCANTHGTRLALVEESGQAFLYNPVDSKVLPIQNIPCTITRICWDLVDPYVLYIFDGDFKIHVFVYNPMTIYGPEITKAGESEFHKDDAILNIQNGVILSLKKDCRSPRQECVGVMNELNRESQSMKRFSQLVAFNRLKQAWKCARGIASNTEAMENLLQKCLESLRIDIALEIYRHQQKVSSVFLLEKLMNIEDINLLSGHVLVILEQYDKAEMKFLASPKPCEALKMRQYLQHWERAYELTQQHAPHRIHETALHYGQYLEFKGKCSEAISKYEEVLAAVEGVSLKHLKSSKAGVARCCLMVGNVMKGTALAKEGSKTLQSECADILEKLKQYETAAELQTIAGNLEKACELYIQASRIDQAKRLISNITTPKIHAMYAKEMEKRKHFEEALRSYEIVKDSLSMIRLFLYLLKRPNDAFTLARQLKDPQCAEMVADFARKKGDSHAAIEFFIISDQLDRAFAVAKEEELFPVFGKFLLQERQNNAFQNYASKVAEYYASIDEIRLAGHWRLQEGKHEIALQLAIDVEDYDLALDVIEDSMDCDYHSLLKSKLHSVFTGHNDGTPKDDIYMYRLHVILGNLDLAVDLARLMAAEEQREGNYKKAKAILLEITQNFAKRDAPLPQDIQTSLVLIQTYMLTKILIKKKKHQTATKLLLRLADHLSHFSRHMVQILITLVIECKKVQWKHLAHKHASTLMLGQHVESIPAKYKRTIENLVRQQPRGDPPNVFIDTPCPFCQNPVPDVDLECDSCKNKLPMCIVSGLHICYGDRTECPHCHQPASHSLFFEHLQTNTACPLCEQKVDVRDLRLQETDI